MGNAKKISRPKNLAQSVGMGVGGDTPLLALGAIGQTSGILGTLADDANLPETIEELDKDMFNNKDDCEFCERNFSKIKGNPRHHCRKCFKSVC